MKVGWFTMGSISVNGASGAASLSIPLSGPKGSGVIYVEAKKKGGTWRYETLEFAPNDGERVPLLDSSLPQIAPTSPASTKDDDAT
jgi:hypothetical protein